MSANAGAADVVIVGGGLHGCSAAYHLAARGLKPIVLEKHVVARHASSASAGGVRRLGRHPAEIPLAQASLEIWHLMGAVLGATGDFRATGQVRVAETEADLKTCEERVALTRSLGYDFEILIDQAELRRRVPAVAHHCLGGIAVERDGYAFPFKTTTAFRHKAEALGAIIHEGTKVIALDRRGAHWEVATNNGVFCAPALVNAAGAWGGELAAFLGDPVPLEPVALMMMASERMAHFVDPTVGAIGRQLSFKQMQSGTVVIGGGFRGRVDRATELTELDFRHLAQSARNAATIFPIMAKARLTRCWAGIEGFTPDDLPFIGPSKHSPAAFHSFGFCGHGFQLGPVVGSITAELIVNGKTNLPIEPFRIDRFDP